MTRRLDPPSRQTGREPALSERERRFVEFYMGDAAGNATKAARLAGYAKNTAEKQASRLLTRVVICRAIDERTKADPAVWTREQRQRFWTAVASGAPGFEKATLRDRLRASELLGKAQADFIERHQLEAGQTWIDALAAMTGQGEPAR